MTSYDYGYCFRYLAHLKDEHHKSESAHALRAQALEAGDERGKNEVEEEHGGDGPPGKIAR